MEVRFADGLWYRGRLVQRVAGTIRGKPHRWKVQFDDREARDDIWLANPDVPVRFDASAYGSTVEVRFARFSWKWRRGRLVELVSGSDVWGVAFEDGDWAEDVKVNSPDVRYVTAAGGGGGGANEGGWKMWRGREGREDRATDEKGDEVGARRAASSAIRAARRSGSLAT